MVMELLSRTLLAHVRKFGFPPYAHCLGVLRSLANTLQFLHARGVMHRDIKLENIMVRGNSTEDVQPVLVDFGLARRESSALPLRGCGTPGYMAPEILRQGAYGKQCDVFSLGVVFYFL
jgi:serine/threonine protein kinase